MSCRLSIVKLLSAFFSLVFVLLAYLMPETHTQGCREALGMENYIITDQQITASSQWDANHAAIQGRLNFTASGYKQGGWSVLTNDVNQWLQVDLGDTYTRITGLATQGRSNADQWVTKYRLQYGYDGVNFHYYNWEQGQSADKEFIANSNRNTVVYHELNPPIMARYIRYRPLAWHGHISMRAEVYGCPEIGCQLALGMENYTISDEQITASSQLDGNHAAIQGRLYFAYSGGKHGGWTAGHRDVYQWLQVDLGDMYTRITGLATQGRSNADQWVTKYKVQYSNDGVYFNYYKEQGQSADKEFIANSDRNTVVYHELNPQIIARYIRFRPLAWSSYISMRAEVYGCSVVPGPPLNVTVDSKTSRVVNISWVVTFNKHSPIQNYTVEISDDNQTFSEVACQGSMSASSCVVSTSSTSASLQGLLPGTTYYIRVSASNAFGASSSSSVVNTTTNVQEEVVPDPPLNVTVDSKNSRVVNISWVAGFDGNSPIQNYTVEISEDNQTFIDVACQGSMSVSSCVVSSSSTSASLQGLLPGTTYYIRVFASNVAGASISSSVVNLTTQEKVVPDPPLNVTVDSKNSRVVNISWVAGFDGNSPIQNYTVEISEDNQTFIDVACQGSMSVSSCVVSSSSTSASLQGLSPGTTYYIRVIASNEVGASSSSSLVNIATQKVVPDPPMNVAVDSKNSRLVNISWVAGFDGNSPIQNYTVEISEDNQTFIDVACQGSMSVSSCVVSSSSTSASLQDLSPGTTYYTRADVDF